MTLLFAEVGEGENICNGRKEHGMVGQKCFTTINGAASNAIGDSMAFVTKFFLNCLFIFWFIAM